MGLETTASATPVQEASSDPTARLAIDRYVRSLRARMLTRVGLMALLSAVGVQVLGIAAWLVAGAPAVGPEQSHFRVVGLAAASVLGLGIVGILIVGLRSGTRGVVRRVGRHDPSLGDDLQSVYELAARRAESSMVEAFGRLHEARVAGQLGALAKEKLVSFQVVMRTTRALAVVAGLTCLAVFLVPNAPVRLLNALGQGTGPDQLPVLLGDAGVAVSVRVHPPKYTGRAPYSVTPGGAGITVPEGARLTVLAKARVEVDAARALTPEGRVVAGEMMGTKHFRVALVARHTGRLVFAFRTPAGVWHLGSTGPLITLKQDAAPTLSIRPDDPVIALEKPGKLPLDFQARDDYGVVEVKLIWHTQAGDRGERVLGRGPRFGPQRSMRLAGRFVWDLSRLGLSPGQRVRFNLEAMDNRALGEAGKETQVSRTPEQTISITGSRSAEENTVASLRRLLRKAVASLADRLEDTPEGTCPARTGRLRVHRLADGALVAAVGAVVSRARKRKGLPTLLRKSLLGPLSAKQRALAAALEVNRGLLAKKGSDPCHRLRALAPGRRRVVATLEELVLLIDDLVGRSTLEQMNDLGRRIASLQRQIERLAEQLRKRPGSAALRKQLAKRLAQIERAFRQLAHLRSSLADEVIDQHINDYAARRRQTSRLLGRLSKQATRGTPSAADLNELKRRVEQLGKALKSGLDSFRAAHPLKGEASLNKRGRAIQDLADAQGRLNRKMGRDSAKALARKQAALAKRARELGGS